jgi:PKD repeat protein
MFKLPRALIVGLLAAISLQAADTHSNRRPARNASEGELNQAAAQANADPVAFKKFARLSPHVHLDAANRAHVICQALPASGQIGPDTTPFTGTATFPPAQTFLLHSRPGAAKVIYLDFKGHVTTGTPWNNSGTAGASFTTPPFDLDGNPAAFSDAELAAVQEIWKRVAEDYAPWEVDVTTEDPGEEALRRTSTGDLQYGVRCVIGGSSTQWLGAAAGGVAYIGTFGGIVAAGPANDIPAFVFPAQLGNSVKAIAEAAAHECGHTLGLYHDGTTAGVEYFAGQGDWAPIMGVSYYKPVTQWSKGEYPLANNTQDQMAIIGSRIPLVAADHGVNQTTALPVSGNSLTAGGIIRSAADSAWYAIQAGAGAINLTALAANKDPDLKISLSLVSAAGQTVAAGTATGPNGMNAALTATLPSAGIYYIVLRGSADGTGATQYGNYASVGRYALTGSWVSTTTLPPPPVYPPVASTTGTTPTTGAAPLTVNFSSAASTATNAGALRYLWNFGDNTATSDLANPSHLYSAPGNYTATLTVIDALGLINTATVVINVTAPPVTPPPVATNVMFVGAMKAGWYDLVNGQTRRRDDDDDDDDRGVVRRAKTPAGYIGCIVAIVDTAGKPVQGATVAMTVTGLANGKVQGRTDRNGQIEVVTPRLPTTTTGSITFTVTGVQLTGRVYDATRNAVTTVTVTR